LASSAFATPRCTKQINMTVTAENGPMGLSAAYAPLEGRFEVIKEIGDGSFGNVVLARVRAAGSSVARRGTMVSFFF
jgi:meiosis induction protein kinase IME2/SME1